MKTLVKHIEIEFSLRYIDDEVFVIDLFEDSTFKDNSLRISGSGFLVGKYNQKIQTQIILQTQIIFNN